jgi:hypothetical protein
MDFVSLPDRPAIAAVIPGSSPAISMSYFEDGSRLFVASEKDSSLQVIDCWTGKASDGLAVPLQCEREKIHAIAST